MKFLPTPTPVILCIVFTLAGMARGGDGDRGWPGWRGPDGTGASMSAQPPTRWSETENIRWKVRVPGHGSSTPIVVADRVYVSTAVKTDRAEDTAATEASSSESSPVGPPQQAGEAVPPRPRHVRVGPAPTHYYAFMVLAYDRASGREVWRTTVTEQVPHEAGHGTNTFASSSPVTDGERVYVSFGSRGVYCLDLDGQEQWGRDLGRMETRAQFGEGSSAAVWDGTLVVPFDHEGDSFIVALDARTGRERWRQPREERTTWSTPLITKFNGRVHVVTNGTQRVRSYDLHRGDLIWECGGQAGNPIPSPVRFEGNVIVMTGYQGYAIYSIPLQAAGDITGSDLVTWSTNDAASYVPSPVLYRGQLYYLKSNNGILISRDAKTGELCIPETRLPEISSVYASPVAAADRIYVTGRDGTTVVVRHGQEVDVISVNKLDEEIDASAALADGEIFYRGKQHLYCVADKGR